MTRRDPRFRCLPRAARALTIATLVAAALAVVLTQPATPLGTTDLSLLALTAVLCAVASFFEVSTPGSSSLHPGLVFVVWAAVLLPPIALPLLAALCFLPSALRGRVRWYVPAFHGAACVLAGVAVHLIAPEGDITGAAGALALGAGAVGFVLIIDGLIALHMRLAWHRPLRVGVKGLAANAPVDLALATTGAALAALWSYDPWLCAILAGPLGLVTRAMLVPALRHKSRTDPKTALFNFEHLRESLDDALRTATRREDAVALVMIDLDHLRTINNRFGHLAGDQAILRVASSLARAAHDRGIAARFGGEEFCLLLPDWTGPQAEALVDGVRAEVRDLCWDTNGEEVRCTFSAGVAVFPKDAEDAEGLLNAADAALYDAKAGGRDRTRLALPEGTLELMQDVASANEHAGRRPHALVRARDPVLGAERARAGGGARGRRPRRRAARQALHPGVRRAPARRARGRPRGQRPHQPDGLRRAARPARRRRGAARRRADRPVRGPQPLGRLRSDAHPRVRLRPGRADRRRGRDRAAAPHARGAAAEVDVRPRRPRPGRHRRRRGVRAYAHGDAAAADLRRHPRRARLLRREHRADVDRHRDGRGPPPVRRLARGDGLAVGALRRLRRHRRGARRQLRAPRAGGRPALRAAGRDAVARPARVRPPLAGQRRRAAPPPRRPRAAPTAASSACSTRSASWSAGCTARTCRPSPRWRARSRRRTRTPAATSSASPR